MSASLHQIEGKKRLTARHSTFVHEYLLDSNATRAAVSAGYSPASAHVTGHRLLKNPQVQAAIQEHLQETRTRWEGTIERILLELEKIAFSNIMDYFQIDEDGSIHVYTSGLKRATAGPIAKLGITRDRQGRIRRVHIKLAPKLKALAFLENFSKGWNKQAPDNGDPYELIKTLDKIISDGRPRYRSMTAAELQEQIRAMQMELDSRRANSKDGKREWTESVP